MNIFERETVSDVDMERFSKVFNDDIKRVIEAVRRYGFDIRVVGGAVRDFLLGKEPRDVDFVTDADPAELILIFDLEGIGYDAAGIKHGTVKAVFGDQKIDVTSMGYRIKVIDGKMAIDRSEGWAEDAANRDLTINSMSLDMDGEIHDYVGGMDDLDAGIIRFNPSQHERIKDDPNIILRWFKSLGYFDSPKWPKKDFDLIKSSMPLLDKVRDDPKTAKTLGSILSYHNSREIIDLMCRMGADEHIDINCD